MDLDVSLRKEHTLKTQLDDTKSFNIQLKSTFEQESIQLDGLKEQ